MAGPHWTYQERYNAFVAIFILLIVATALFIAGTSTSFNTFKDGNHEIYNTFFYTRNTQGGSEAYSTTVPACDDFYALIEAGRAFSLATTIMAGLLMLGAFVRLLHNDLMLGNGRVPFITFMVLTVVTGCVMWILAFVAYADTFCGVSLSDDPNTRVGPCGPLFLTGWVIMIIVLALEITYDGAAEDPAPHTVSSASGSHVLVPAASTTHGAAAAPAPAPTHATA